MINFLRYSVTSYVLSATFIAAGVGALVYYNGFRYSVDFTGGTQILLKFDQPFGSEKIKDALIAGGWDDPSIREFGENEVAVRVKEFTNDSQGVSLKIKQQLEQQLGTCSIEIKEANAVGPGVGKALREDSIWAVLLGLLLMLFYIAFRFWSFSYGAGATIAILHDALAILAVFAITQREISPNVICAILATLGYSINDTIVIFAKIRENFVKMKGESPRVIVNTSINQTLRRTLLTSLSTALVVVSLFIFGGETLRNLSLALLVGIVVGTYSSVYIASPIMLSLRKEA